MGFRAAVFMGHEGVWDDSGGTVVSVRAFLQIQQQYMCWQSPILLIET